MLQKVVYENHSVCMVCELGRKNKRGPETNQTPILQRHKEFFYAYIHHVLANPVYGNKASASSLLIRMPPSACQYPKNTTQSPSSGNDFNMPPPVRLTRQKIHGDFFSTSFSFSTDPFLQVLHFPTPHPFSACLAWNAASRS